MELAAVGGVIDFLLSKAQQAKLKAWLENWWLRFSYVNWRNFGRREAEAAVAMLDRWAGPRLWSWKRWRFSILVCLWVRAFMVMTMIALIPLQDLIAMYGAEPDRPTDSLLKFQLDEALVVPSVMIAFALSLSLTRAVAVLIGKMCRGTIMSGDVPVPAGYSLADLCLLECCRQSADEPPLGRWRRYRCCGATGHAGSKRFRR